MVEETDAAQAFRDAGHFWEIAPGTPSVIRTRIARVDNTLKIARSLLEEKGVEGIAARHGKALFDRRTSIESRSSKKR